MLKQKNFFKVCENQSHTKSCLLYMHHETNERILQLNFLDI